MNEVRNSSPWQYYATFEQQIKSEAKRLGYTLTYTFIGATRTNVIFVVKLWKKVRTVQIENIQNLGSTVY